MRDLLRSKLPSVWLSGEIQRLRRSGRGHLYFELVEKGREDDVVAKLEAVIWRSDLEKIERDLEKKDQRLIEGVEIRCWVQADFYPPFGRFQIVVRRIDPEFTLGLLSRRRRETLKALHAAGLLETNKALALSPVPLRVGLITSHGSAAYHDFISTLKQSGYGFEVEFLHSAVQGREAEIELLAAVRRAVSLPIDCLAIVRGGGSRSDLAVFDSRKLAESLAVVPLPLITGLGHEIDESVVDLVAHTRTRTPTQAAEFLAARVRDADAALVDLTDRMVRFSRGSLSVAGGRLRELGRELVMVRYRVSGSASRLESFVRRLRSSASVRVAAATANLAARRSRLGVLASVCLRETDSRIEQFALRAGRVADAEIRGRRTQLANLERLCRQLSPEKTLRRGFSITRGEDGKVLRTAARARGGERLETQLADGIVTSRVES